MYKTSHIRDESLNDSDQYASNNFVFKTFGHYIHECCTPKPMSKDKKLNISAVNKTLAGQLIVRCIIADL